MIVFNGTNAAVKASNSTSWNEIAGTSVLRFFKVSKQLK